MQFTTLQGSFDPTLRRFDEIPVNSYFTATRPAAHDWSFVGERLFKISNDAFTQLSMTYKREHLHPRYLCSVYDHDGYASERRLVLVSEDFQGKNHFPGMSFVGDNDCEYTFWQ